MEEGKLECSGAALYSVTKVESPQSSIFSDYGPTVAQKMLGIIIKTHKTPSDPHSRVCLCWISGSWLYTLFTRPVADCACTHALSLDGAPPWLRVRYAFKIVGPGIVMRGPSALAEYVPLVPTTSGRWIRLLFSQICACAWVEFRSDRTIGASEFLRQFLSWLHIWVPLYPWYKRYTSRYVVLVYRVHIFVFFSALFTYGNQRPFSVFNTLKLRMAWQYLSIQQATTLCGDSFPASLSP